MAHEWVSVREASRRLGISPETVRRRIESGELVGERETIGGSRERFRVRMETPQDASGERPDMPMTPSTIDTTETPHEPPTTTARLLGMLANRDVTLERLHAEIAALSERAGRAEARAETLQGQMEQYIYDQLDQTERAHRAEVELEASNAELARLRRPWWRRIWER